MISVVYFASCMPYTVSFCVVLYNTPIRRACIPGNKFRLLEAYEFHLVLRMTPVFVPNVKPVMSQ